MPSPSVVSTPTIKTEPGLNISVALNYSQLGEDEIITLGDSDEEDGYEASHTQSMLFDGLDDNEDHEDLDIRDDVSDVEELLRDSPSPDLDEGSRTSVTD